MRADRSKFLRALNLKKDDRNHVNATYDQFALSVTAYE